MQWMMRKALCSALLLAGLPSVLMAAEWSYSVRTDSFDDNEIKTATLLGNQSGSTLSVIQMQKGGTFVQIASPARFDCFPDCTVRVKFGQAEPVSFKAKSPRIISASVFINDHAEFLRLLSTTTGSLVVRAPFARYSPDLDFSIERPFTPDSWEPARSQQEKQKRCQENAVNENFSACMARQ